MRKAPPPPPRYLGNTGGISMFDMFNTIWRELEAEGRITEAEYVQTNFPQCYRTVEQFAAPLRDESNPVYRAGLRLEHIETRVVRCPFAVDFETHGGCGEICRRLYSDPSFLVGNRFFSPGCRPRAPRRNGLRSSMISTKDINNVSQTLHKDTPWIMCTAI